MQNPSSIPILLVDDLPENLIALEALLSELPLELEIVKANSGEEGLRHTLKRDFALILLDVQMPGMNGFETADLLRANPKTRHLPILFVTAGMNDEQHAFNGYELGAVDYLIKPIEPIVLRSKVTVFCELYAQRREIEFNRVNLSVQVDERTAELSKLALTLTEEVKARRDTEERLRELNEQLESRVEQRTLELQRALHQVVESERLAALGSLVAGVAHELNTPIGNCVGVASTLQGQAQTMTRELQSGHLRRSEFERFLGDAISGHEILMRNLTRASTLVESFKHVAVDQTSNQRRKFDLRHVLEEDIMTLRPMYKKTPYTFEADLQSGIVLDSYPGPMGQILTNFISNALAHAFENRAQGGMFLNTRLLDEEHVEIIFRDDGNGIQERHLKHVFDPFFTTKLGKGGSGLGLSIVYNLVTGVLGGTIAISNEPGGGTRFTMVLPLCAPDIHPE
ncbi:MAG: response regulator [Burkholderiaceae bacterium]|nr:response regulator [Burkholderiaceae bacterium]